MEKMKIGIITQPLHTNYGGLLQNYALQQVLKRMGHEPITFNVNSFNLSRLRICFACLKTLVLKLLGKGEHRIYPCYVSNRKKLYIRQYTNYFINKYIKFVPIQDLKEDLRKYTIDNKLNALIVGSDQVWRPIYNQNILRSFLDFANGLTIKRIAYAASFGVDYWEFNQQQTLKAQKLIRDFDAISVREQSGLELCRRYLHRKALHVLDPTFLLNKNDYIRLVEIENEPISKGNLFAYFLDNSDEKKRVIKILSSELNLCPFSLIPENSMDIFPPVTQWIRAFMDAEFIVCDSFHGAVFSIIFNKPFLIIGNKMRGMARFDSLLDTFELHNRMIDNIDKIYTVINAAINWEKVNQIHTRMKEYSLLFLKTNLI